MTDARKAPSRLSSALKSKPVSGWVLVDSGPLIALFSPSDHWNLPVQRWLQTNEQARLMTTWPVATEVCALLARRRHNEVALDFLRWAQRGGINFDLPTPLSLDTVLGISARFADLPFDLADASVAEAAARLQIKQILSINRDFDVYRDSSGTALTNLLAASL